MGGDTFGSKLRDIWEISTVLRILHLRILYLRILQSIAFVGDR